MQKRFGLLRSHYFYYCVHKRLSKFVISLKLSCHALFKFMTLLTVSSIIVAGNGQNEAFMGKQRDDKGS